MPRRRNRNHLDAAFYRRLDDLTHHLTFFEIGRLTSTVPESCRRYIHGTVKPTTEWLAQLCDVTGASLDWLVMGNGRPPRLRR